MNILLQLYKFRDFAKIKNAAHELETLMDQQFTNYDTGMYDAKGGFVFETLLVVGTVAFLYYAFVMCNPAEQKPKDFLYF